MTRRPSRPRGRRTGARTAPTRSTTTTPARTTTRSACTRTRAAAAHMGHVRNYTFGDLIVRYRTMNGHAVLSPMGFDSFGLPAENAAIKTGRAPARVHRRAHRGAAQLDRTHRRRCTTGGARSRATIRSTSSCTQWIFLRLFEAGLAYRKKAPVNWCPGCQTVLANEQVLADGTCERSGDVVEKRDLEQWFFKITDYAATAARRPRRAGLARAGQDHAAQLDRPVRGRRVRHGRLRRRRQRRRRACPPSACFTTRPDTSFGMTYAVLAPEHPLVPTITTDDRSGPRSRPSSRGSATTSEIDRHVVRGRARQARHLHRRLPAQPLHRAAGAPLPRRLRADGLRHRGDHGGARPRTSATGTSPRPTTCRSSAPSSRPTTGTARPTRATARTSTAPGSTGSTRPKAIAEAIEWLEQQGIGERKVNFRLRDWLVSRQRFWGCPIPIVYCAGPRHRARARRPAPGAGARRRRVPAHRRVAAAAARRLPAHDLPEVRRAPPPARPTRWTRSSTRPGTSCASPTRGTARCPFAMKAADGLDARRPVHRRGRARHPAPHVRPILHQGALGPGRARRRSCASRSSGCSPRA